MPLETGSSIQSLDSSWPLGGDRTNRGDDHIRLVKSVLKAQFPGSSGQGFASPILATEEQINFLVGLTSNVQTQLNDLTQKIQDMYPIGSIYTNASVDTNPGSLLGFGTWTRFGQGRVMVGQSSDTLFNAPEQTGGSKDAVVVQHSHTGTTNSSGEHTHTYSRRDGELGGNYTDGGPYGTSRTINTGSSGAHSHSVTTSNTGESGANKNLQPYIVVYSWKRTA